MRKWDVVFCLASDHARMQALLDDGWEPFTADSHVMYFRMSHPQPQQHKAKQR